LKAVNATEVVVHRLKGIFMKNFEKIVIFVLLIFCVILIGANRAKAAEPPVNANTMCYCTCQPYTPAETTATPASEPEIISVESSAAEDALLPEEIEGATASVDPEDSETATENIDSPIVLEEETEPIVSEEALVPDIVISEFVSDPVSGGKEWVELFNHGAGEVDLAGWTIEEGSGAKTQLTGTLAPQAYLAVEKSSLNNDGDIIILKDSSGVIGDSVAYGDWDDGDVSDNAPAPSDPNSVILTNLDNVNANDAANYQLTTEPTRGAANVFIPLPVVENPPVDSPPEVAPLTTPEENPVVEEDPAPVEVDYANTVRINEFLPDPSGADTGREWIELFNLSGSEINLKDWTLDDEEGGSTSYKIPADFILPAGGYALFGNDATKLVLNNTSDHVRLFSPDGKMIDDAAYSGVKENQADSYFSTGFVWNNNLTPGAVNSLAIAAVDAPLAVASNQTTGLTPMTLAKLAYSSTPATKKTSTAVKAKSQGPLPLVVSIVEARKLAVGTLIQLVGKVSARPGPLGDRVAYLADAEAGLQIYYSKADWPDFRVGDTLAVVGKLSESLGERRLLIAAKTDIVINGSGQPSDIAPLNLQAEAIGEEKEGMLIALSGEVVEKNGAKIKLADDSGEAIIWFKAGANISANTYTLGDKIKVTGIVSQYNSEYRILPRGANDLEQITIPPAEDTAPPFAVKSPASAPARSFPWFTLAIVSLSVAGAGVAAYFYREKLKVFFSAAMLKLKLLRNEG
jgi:hypothetical protein